MKYYSKDEIMNVLRGHIIHKGDQAAFALDHGFSTTFIGDVLKGKRPLSDRLIESLGFEIRYVRRNGETRKLLKDRK